MRFVKILPFALVLWSVPSWAGVITFDDLTTNDSFWDLGIADTYHGYVWSPSLTAPATTQVTWTSATVTEPPIGNLPGPTPVSGQSYAWPWGGGSLFIHFRTAVDFDSVWLATLTPTYPFNASSVQLFGYDVFDTLVVTGPVLSLTGSFQLYTANFKDIYKVEFRGNVTPSYFTVDDITVTPTGVPEPSSAALLALGGLAITGWRRLRSKRVRMRMTA